MRAPLTSRDPAAEIRKGFGRAPRADLSLVDFLAIETQTGDVKLHPEILFRGQPHQLDPPQISTPIRGEARSKDRLW
jgi:hypothetical protein